MAYTFQQLGDCAAARICTYDGSSWAQSAHSYIANTWQRQIIVVNSSGTYFYYNNESTIIRYTAGVTAIGTWTLQDVRGAFDNIAICTGSNFDCGIEVAVPSVSVILNSPANNTQTTDNFTLYNATITPNTFNVTNATLNIWYSNGTLFTANTTTLTGSSANTTTWNISFTTAGTYLWNVLGVQGNSNGTNSSFATNNFTRRYSLITTNSYVYNSQSYETARESFVVNVTSNSAPTNAFLIYNGTTIQSATITNIAGNYYNLSASIDLPVGVYNNSLYFNMTLSGFESTSDTIYQDVLNTSLVMTSNAACSAGSLPYLNITFADENNLTILNELNDATNIYYWIGNGTTNKTLTASNSTPNLFYQFCLSPQNRTLGANLTLQHSAGGYPSRTYVNSSMSLTNSSYTRTLYSLSSGDGIYVTFQVINEAQQQLEGTIANITRTISGSTAIVGAGTTGADGGITYWLDPDNTYTINFFKSGYPSYTTTQQFTQSSYTITLGGTGTTSGATDYQQDINYTILPSTITYLNNDTIYNFNFTISSFYLVLDGFGFNITDGDGNFYGSVSSTASSGGFVGLNINTSRNDSLIMNAYWTINGTNTTIATNWLVLDVSGNSFSISRLLSDFGSFITAGMFGLDNFGVGIIVFLIIILVTGTLKVKVGISNTAVILGVIWGLVAFFDITTGLIPNPIGAIPAFPTILIGVIVAAIWIKETIQ